MTTRKGVELSNGIEIFRVSFRESLKGVKRGTARKKKTWHQKYVEQLRLGLETLDKHVYWTRLWILQELSQANKPPRVLCGPLELDIRNLCAVSYYNLKSDSKEIPDMCSVLEKLCPKWAGTGVLSDVFKGGEHSLSDRRLPELLSLFSYWRCADPRDRIFGLKSISATTSQVQPDYEESRIDLACRVIPYCNGIADLMDVLDALHYAVVCDDGSGMFQFWHIDPINESRSLLADVELHASGGSCVGTAMPVEIECTIFALKASLLRATALEITECNLSSIEICFTASSPADSCSLGFSDGAQSALARSSSMISILKHSREATSIATDDAENDTPELDRIAISIQSENVGTANGPAEAGDYLLYVYDSNFRTLWLVICCVSGSGTAWQKPSSKTNLACKRWHW